MREPIELNQDERGAALLALRSALYDNVSDIDTLARVFDAINRLRMTPKGQGGTSGHPWQYDVT
jgi:hypothetical protein